MEEQQLNSILLALLDSALLAKSTAYAAGPLDSGRRFYEQLASGVPKPEVRQQNQQRLSLFVQRLRNALSYPVFDPGVLRVPLWTDAQHGSFFLRVIEKIAKEVWFVDGWEFSIGATKEFVYSCKLRLPCLDERGNEINLQLGKKMIRDAAEYVRGLGLDASKLMSRIS
jgi:hypothetical protein